MVPASESLHHWTAATSAPIAGMNTFLYIALGLGLAGFCSADNCMRWTPWINGDDPGSGGDLETVGYYNELEDRRVGSVTKKLEAMGIICTNPLKIECREANSKVPWFKSGDSTNFPYRINCELRRGFACKDSHQADGSCHDYEVRMLCWTACPQLSWTPWTNRDRPSGNCDCEYPGWADHSVRNAPACPDGQSPVEIECQTSAGVPAASGPDAITQCNVDRGFSCVNKLQPDGRCKADYRVRYLCFNPAPPPSATPPTRRKSDYKSSEPIIPQHSLFPTF